MVFYILVFLGSMILLPWLGSRLIKNLIGIAKFLGWREFIVAFFIMAFVGSLPNLFVDIGAALRGIPELAFGDIIGGNVVDLTLVAALAVFLSRKGLVVESKMVQTSVLFTSVATLLPLFLILDGRMTRLDGLALIVIFCFYIFWIFSKKERFTKAYKVSGASMGILGFLKSSLSLIFLLALLLLASQGIVKSCQFFSVSLGIPIALIGIFIVGLGNCFPEAYFAIVSARKEENWMILGNLMGSVISCATLILGIVALIAPFEIKDLSPFFIARAFTIIAAIFFLIILRTGKRVTKGEGIVLLGIYVLFLVSEIFFR